MRNFCEPDIDRWRIQHPAGEVIDELRPWAGCFQIPFRPMANVGLRSGPLAQPVSLRVIATRGGYTGPGADEAEMEAWDHLSASTATRCPTWEELEFLKRLFFKPDECAMQLHVPPRDHINNHPYCLHIWRPLNFEIPRPPSIMVGHQSIGLLPV